MQFIDTHCHIHEAQVDAAVEPYVSAMWAKSDVPDPDDMITEAAKSDVTRMICVGTSAEDSALAVDFVQDRAACWASVGLHPHETKSGEAARQKLAELIGADPRAQKIVAIGECGLDYCYNHSPKKDQIAALHFQIELALKHDLPLIFHVREAFDDFWPIFDSYQNVRGVLHSFTDSRANLDKALERGLHIGVNGIMTFTKDPAQLETTKAIPLQKLLIETDAPFLTPRPFRGKVNKPANARLVAEFLAELRHESLHALADQTTTNALTLFKI